MTDHGDLNQVFKALAHPTRRGLLDSLRREDGQTLGELCAGVEMARQSVTQHLNLLVDADLVVVVRRGRERRHYLNTQPIHEIDQRWVRDFDQDQLTVLDAVKRRAEEASMNTEDQFLDYVYATYIRASPQAVWDALTDPRVTQAYWNGMANVSDWQPGSTWTHRKGSTTGDYDIWGKVLEHHPPRRLVFTFQPASQDLNEPGSIVSYELEQADDVVRLTVTHTRLPDAATREGIAQGWPAVLASLKSYLETGDALPEASWLLTHR